MQRRPFIKLLGIGLSSFAFSPTAEGYSGQEQWQQWITQLVSVFQIEKAPSANSVVDRPFVPAAVQSGEFIVADPNTYFYEKGTYCFQVFKKVHASAGLLELMIPFWKKQPNGNWTKITCLSLHDLATLAHSTSKFPSGAERFLLPKTHTNHGLYGGEQGIVHITSRLQTNKGISTEIQVKDENQIIWNNQYKLS